jgi:predicted tellurium resistance membrane protein TerC
MSLDNVLAVAGVARDHLVLLAIGLTLSVLLMGTAAAFVARLTSRYPWIAYAGLLVVLYTAAKMIWEGSRAFV